MSLPFWTQRQQKRITTRAKRLSRKGHGTGARAARYCLPRLEELEDRTVLSSVTRDFSGSGAQFAGFNPAITTFLGDEFDRSASFGSVRHVALLGDFGATANMSIGGRAGLSLRFSGAGGTVTAEHNATLTQDFSEPYRFGQFVNFNPANTFVTLNSGSFETTSPSFGYG